MQFTFQPIGRLESPFREKFGVPRQSQLVPAARSVLKLDPACREALTDLEGFSHVWVIFVFHAHVDAGWNPLVRPPRLGGTAKTGVFSTRAPHRPNPIGLSLVRLEAVDRDGDPPTVTLSGGDFVDGTPVLDLKPYLPGADHARGEVRCGWLEQAPDIPRMEVVFAPTARAVLDQVSGRGGDDLEALVTEMLALDPRPAFQRGEDADYAARVLGFDVHWVTEGRRCRVVEIRIEAGRE